LFFIPKVVKNTSHRPSAHQPISPGTSFQSGGSVECPAGCQHPGQFPGAAVASLAPFADLVAAVDFGTAVDAWDMLRRRKTMENWGWVVFTAFILA
jgi:hypothetical protein